MSKRVWIELQDDGSIHVGGTDDLAEWCAQHGRELAVVLHNVEKADGPTPDNGHYVK